MKIGAILLASGLSKRFGTANKLLEKIGNRPMVCYTINVLAVNSIDRLLVVFGDERIAVLAAEYGFDLIRNEEPERGQGHTIALGVRAMADMDAVLLLAADMPLLSSASLQMLLRAFDPRGCDAACLEDETHWGNPAIFGSVCFDELMRLDGERGAKSILHAHEERLLRVSCAFSEELTDVDTPEMLEKMRLRCAK